MLDQVLRIVVSNLGTFSVPAEFRHLFEYVKQISVKRAENTRPSEVVEALKHGEIVVLIGRFEYVDGIMHFVNKFQNRLVQTNTTAEDRSSYFQRTWDRETRRRTTIARLMVALKGEELVEITGSPKCDGLTDWLSITDFDPREEPFLVPLRRFFRILTDMKRCREGMPIHAIGDSIIVFPHVYVPVDQSIVDLLSEHLSSGEEAGRVLDMGTGTGILGLVAAKRGATKVVLTDISPNAVENAKLNVERLRLEDTVEVREPADLFNCVVGEIFDTIIFNPPWVLGEPATLYDAAIYDKDQQILTRFISMVRVHLSPQGKLLLIYSDISQSKGDRSIDRLNELLADNVLEIVNRRWKTRRSRLLGATERVYLFDIRPKMYFH